MPLSNKDLSDIAKEFATAKGELTDDKNAIPNIQEQVDKKQEQADRINILYKDAHVERVTPYEIEHRWIDGTTYTTITQQQIDDSAARLPSSLFFPSSWTKSNAQLSASGNGNPRSSSPNSESAVLNSVLENGGLIAQIGLLRNGQASAASSETLDLAYSPGATTLTFDNAHSFTIGRYLYISGSGTSALVKITASTSLTINIIEIIPPATTIASGGTAVENIIGFTNSERQTLTSATYQRILTQLTTMISSAAGLYAAAIANQIAQLTINIDAAAQVTAAKTAATNAQTAYNTWNGLAATGVGGKWTDTPLNNLATSYNARNAGFATRISQIATALGSVAQDGEGIYTGNGNYLQRFKTLNFLINTANGPLYQINGLKSAKGNFQDKVANTTDKLATFSNLVRYGGFTADPMGTLIMIDGASSFAPGDSVLLCGTDLPSVECTVVSVSSASIVLNITVPPAYTKGSKSGIIKRV